MARLRRWAPGAVVALWIVALVWVLATVSGCESAPETHTERIERKYQREANRRRMAPYHECLRAKAAAARVGIRVECRP